MLTLIGGSSSTKKVRNEGRGLWGGGHPLRCVYAPDAVRWNLLGCVRPPTFQMSTLWDGRSGSRTAALGDLLRGLRTDQCLALPRAGLSAA